MGVISENQRQGVTRVSVVKGEDGTDQATLESVTEAGVMSYKGNTRESTTEESTTGESKPTQFAGKFDSVETLEQGYLELQKQYSTRDTKATETTETTEDGEAETGSTESNTAELFENASKEWSETGEITAETLTAITEMGVPQAFIDQFVQSSNAVAELTRIQVLEAVGGEKGFERLSEWAGTNLNTEQLDGFNAILDTGDAGQIKLVLGTLQNQMGSTNFVSPDAPNNTTEAGFSSRTEMSKAISDPRYGNDPKYRAMVEQQVMKTNI